MSKITRHVGKVKNTGLRCVVVLRKMPGDTGVAEDRDHALIIESDSLSDMYHDNLMAAVDSTEAQQTHDLYSILARRTFSDGGNMINTLHNKGLMRKIKVDDVILHPMPGHTLSLRAANDAIDGIVSQPSTVEAELTKQAVAEAASTTPGSSIARGLLMQADLLEQEAAKKREEAYTVDPGLRPTVGRPSLSTEEKELRKIKRNERRRERYQTDAKA